MKALSAKLEGKQYKSKIKWRKQVYYQYICKQSHCYTVDAGMGGVEHCYKQGWVKLFSTKDDIHAMNPKMWKFIKKVLK